MSDAIRKSTAFLLRKAQFVVAAMMDSATVRLFLGY
jgi:hypothetical protein